MALAFTSPGIACTQTTAIAGVTDATAIQFQAISVLAAVGTAGVDVIKYQGYAPGDTTCSTPLGEGGEAYFAEPAGMTAGTEVDETSYERTHVMTNPEGQFYVKDVGSSAGEISSGVAELGIRIQGYFN